jgi:hypothetical protein
MNNTPIVAWIVAGLIAVIVAGLFLRRSLTMRQPNSPYRALEIATLIATAGFVGALMGLVAFLIVSRLGG